MFHALNYTLSKQNVFSLTVWCNTNICVGNNINYVKMWYEHSVKIISNFLKQNIFYHMI